MEDVQVCLNRPNSVAVNSADDEKHRPLKFTNENTVILFNYINLLTFHRTNSIYYYELDNTKTLYSTQIVCNNLYKL